MRLSMRLPWQRRLETEQDCQDAQRMRRRLSSMDVLEQDNSHLKHTVSRLRAELEQTRQLVRKRDRYILELEARIIRFKKVIQHLGKPAQQNIVFAETSNDASNDDHDHVVDLNNMLEPYQRQGMWLLRKLNPKHSYEWLGKYLFEHGVTGKNGTTPVSSSTLRQLRNRGFNHNPSAGKSHKRYTCTVRESLARQMVTVLVTLLEQDERDAFKAWIEQGAHLDDA